MFITSIIRVENSRYNLFTFDLNGLNCTIFSDIFWLVITFVIAFTSVEVKLYPTIQS